MPLVQIKSLQGFLSAEKKQEIIKRVTEALISVEGEAVRPFTWVIIDEVSMESWGIGGQAVNIEMIQKLLHRSNPS